MKFKVSTQDNIPIEDSAPDAVVVKHGFSYSDADSISKAPIPANGIVSFTYVTPSNELLSVSSVEVTYKEFKQHFYLPQKMQSTSKIYLQLTLKSENVTSNENIELNLKSTKEFNSFKYIIFGKGIILKSKTISLPTPAKDHSFKIKAPACAAPEGKVIVYSIFGENNEIVAQSVKFSLGSILSNTLDLTLSAETLEPGQNLTISMKTKANSMVALRGVDQSVLLLKNDKDINMERIEAELKEMDQNRNSHNRIWGGSGSFQIFEEVGLTIITNGALDKPKYYEPYSINDDVRIVGGMEQMPAGAMMMDMAAPMAKMAMGGAVSRSESFVGGKSTEIRVRKDFPETWLWEEFWLNAKNRSSSFNKVVPDTLTSWIITGYSLNSEAGIGVSLEPLVLKTFRPFFISLNLPYAVVKGEVLALQVLVHNYLDKQVTATVILSNEEGKFDFADPKLKKHKKMSKQVSVGASQVSSVKFVIVPTKFGILMLNVQGKTNVAGDALSQPLTVKPPGHKQTKNRAVLIDLRSKKSAKHNFTAEFPTKRVKGADVVKISVIGDLLGATISNLDKLLQMPCGCGEQNMLNFVPDVVILDYLTSTKRLTSEIKSKAIKFLESGYQRELTYRHNDGSFSAFGNSDPIGSTWLTAFVVRSFVAARPYITIDENIIDQSLQYLVQRQQENGSFQELGTVLHSDMQGGGSSSGHALTAYTLLAFIEAGANNSSNKIDAGYSAQIEKGLNYIANAASHSHSDKYALILIAYTLELAKHRDRKKFFESVKDAAISSGDLTYWEQTKKISESSGKHHPWESSHVTPVTVEMTSYALMTYLHRNKISDSLAIGKWLLKQRNAEGGFLSTQDTVVGLTALAKFAALTSGVDPEMVLKAKHKSGTEEIRVNAENAIVLQEFYLPKNTKSVNLLASGKGTALAQLTWSYYLEDGSSKPAFTVNVQAETVTTKLKLNICAKYIAGEKSNMAVVEVNVPSGFSFDHDELALLKQIPKMKRYDLEDGDTKLVIYFDSLDNEKTCLKISAQRVFSVGKQAPAYVLVYDYYDTTKKARAFYEAPKLESASCPVCENGEDCDMSNCA